MKAAGDVLTVAQPKVDLGRCDIHPIPECLVIKRQGDGHNANVQFLDQISWHCGGRIRDDHHFLHVPTLPIGRHSA